MPTTYGVLMKDNVNYSHDTAESIAFTTSDSTSLQYIIDDITSRTVPSGGTSSTFLRGDGQWATAPDTTYNIGNGGLVRKLTGATDRYFRGDGNWIVVDTTYAVMTSGTTGRVPTGGTNAKYLRGDATWQTPTNTTYGIATANSNGIVRKLDGSSVHFFRGDGTWQTPPNDNYRVDVMYTTNNADRQLLLANSTNDTTETAYAIKSKSGITYNCGGTIFYTYDGSSHVIIRSNYIRVNEKSWIYHNSSQNLTFSASSSGGDVDLYGCDLGVADSAWSFRGHADTYMNAGDGNLRWSVVYANSATINTSDRNQKKDIKELDSMSEDFIMDLKPVSYKWKDKKSDRTHYGLIAQDVEETMNKFGMTAMDFAGFCKDQKTESRDEPVLNQDGTIVDDTEGNPLTYKKQYPIEGEYRYSLRYEEFIAPMIKTIQIRQKELDEQEELIKTLEARITALESA